MAFVKLNSDPDVPDVNELLPFPNTGKTSLFNLKLFISTGRNETLYDFSDFSDAASFSILISGIFNLDSVNSDFVDVKCDILSQLGCLSSSVILYSLSKLYTLSKLVSFIILLILYY